MLMMKIKKATKLLISSGSPKRERLTSVLSIFVTLFLSLNNLFSHTEPGNNKLPGATAFILTFSFPKGREIP